MGVRLGFAVMPAPPGDPADIALRDILDSINRRGARTTPGRASHIPSGDQP
ncbi:MAG: hypothetical protein ACSLE1_11625 [Sphingobium sp.]